MLRSRFAWQSALLFAACEGCAPAAGVDDTVPYSDGSERASALQDRDQDGLCDDTEAFVGTDPAIRDTDGDGLLDAQEEIAGTDPRDRFEPNADRIAYLPFGSSVEMAVSIVIDDPTSTVTGVLIDRNALDKYSRRAGDFFRAGRAVSAEPPDSVRGIDPQRPRFSDVLSRARLQFRLQFVVDEPQPDDCAAVLPFDYVATDELGSRLASERAVLVVGRSSSRDATTDYCLPAACL